MNGSTNRSGSLSVALAGSDGRILGGCVVGALVAATQVQVQEYETFFFVLILFYVHLIPNVAHVYIYI